MEIRKWKTGILERFGKYKYVLVVILAGIVLMMLPENTERAPGDNVDIQAQVNVDMSAQLSDMLMLVEGAGKVNVFLSVARGEQVIYQTDNAYSESNDKLDTKSQTVLVTDSERNENGLVYQKNPPTYLGAIVIAQGGADPKVKLELVEAVSKATGLGADRISVLRMK